MDAIAAGREVILFDNVGVGGTSGTTPRNVSEMAAGGLSCPGESAAGEERQGLGSYAFPP